MTGFPRQRVRRLIRELAAYPESREVGNPWLDQRRARNLEAYLQALWGEGVAGGAMLVGEALGYRGGWHTGIPFSSSRLLAAAPHPFLRRLRPALELDGACSEATAEATWQALLEVPVLPLFWNAFAWHPHRVGCPDTNRKPRAGEIRASGPVLAELVALFRPSLLVGVGREGERALRQLFPEARIDYVRHPARGGARAFLAGLQRLFVA